MVGETFSSDGDVTGIHGTSDIWVVKLSSTGTLLWNKTIGGSTYDTGRSIEQTLDGGYIVGGSSQSNDGDVSVNQGSWDYLLASLDMNGNLLWTYAIGGTSVDQVQSVHQTADGGYVLGGSSSSNDGDVVGNHGNYDYWMVRFDQNAVFTGQISLGGTGDDEAFSLQLTSDGGFIITGSSPSIDGDVSGNHGNFDFWTVKLSSSGAIQWSKSLGSAGVDEAMDVKPTTDGGFIVAGIAQSNDGDVTGNHGGWDYWVVKLAAMTGLNESNLNDQIHVFPNPVKSNLQLTTDVSLVGTDYSITDNSGKTILAGSILSENTMVNTNSLPEGLYFIKFSGDLNSTFKIIKE
jgi:hypothetical protein